MNRENYCDMVIVGGGAAGLAGAVAALDEVPGLNLKILEAQGRVGKKLLATGNGRCNYTNTSVSRDNYFGDKTRGMEVLERFSPEDNIEFFRTLGIYPRYEGEGRVYPYSNQAAAVVDALRFGVEHRGGEIVADSSVVGIKATNKGFSVTTTTGKINCRVLLLACGGGAAPDLGGGFSGYKLAKSLGHRVVEPTPALTPLKTENSLTKALKGLKFTGDIFLLDKGEEIGAARGEVLFTDYGLSGIAAMSLSCGLPLGTENLEVALDFFPDLSCDELEEVLTERRRHLGYLTLENYFTGLVNKKIGQQLLKRILQRQLSQSVADLSDQDLGLLSKELKNFTLKVLGDNGWKQAQTTAGGVSFEEIDTETLESKLVPGLYFAGEILNIYGDCGGYNLQWAWSSGRLGAVSAAKSLSEEKC